MNVAIEAVYGLAGFTFTTANDIETRTLPLLAASAADADFRFNACAVNGVCCRVDATYAVDDVASGCTATTLAEYCQWKHSTSASLSQRCETGPTNADDEVATAAANWLEVLDRNYKHHEKARGVHSGGSNTVGYTNPATSSDVQLEELAGLVPHILADNMRYFDHKTDFPYHGSKALLKQPMHDLGLGLVNTIKKSWNMLEFSGGGSALDFSTNKLKAISVDAVDSSTGETVPTFEDTMTQTRRDDYCGGGLSGGSAELEIISALQSASGDSRNKEDGKPVKDLVEENKWGMAMAALEVAAIVVPFLMKKSGYFAATSVVLGNAKFFARTIPKIAKLAHTVVTAAEEPEKLDARCGRGDVTRTVGRLSHPNFSFKLFGSQFKWDQKSEKNLKFRQWYETYHVRDKSEKSQSMFHLSDPDQGDYFVVSVWHDPDYGTALLSLDGGASQCGWEVGTVHRSAPTIAAEYIGPDALGPDDPAMFKITIGNSIDYYGSGPRLGTNRIGWSIKDGGYHLSDYQLVVDPSSVRDGMTVTGALGMYTHFGKGAIDILVQANRGSELYKYYVSPVMTWSEICRNQAVGYDFNDLGESTSLRLSMPNAEQVIEFTPPCPSIEWSGVLVNDQFFSSLSGGDNTVDARAIIGTATGRDVLRVGLEYRLLLASGITSPWHGFGDGKEVLLASTDGTEYSANWDVSNHADGIYEVRATIECTESSPLETWDSSWSPTVKGVLDRAAPVLVQLSTSSNSGVFAPGDHFVLTYSEDIVCGGHLLDGVTKADLKATITFGDDGERFTTGVESANILHSCDGPEVKLALPSFDAAAAESVAGEAIAITVEGLYDLAGNPAVAVTDRVLAAGGAGNERDAIKSSLVTVHGSVGSVLDSVESVAGTANASKTILESVDSDMQSMKVTLASVVASLASLTEQVAVITSSTLGSDGTTVRCGGDSGATMDSFSTYIRACLQGARVQQLTGVTDTEACGEKCLANTLCTGFAFQASSLECTLGLTQLSSLYSASSTTERQWQLYRRKAADECE